MNPVDSPLTEGSVAILLGGGSLSSPVVQILGSKKVNTPPNERYRLLISDGCFMSSLVMLSTLRNDKMTAGELPDYTVIRVDRWATSTVNEKRAKRILIILELTVLEKGDEGGSKIGYPITFADTDALPTESSRPPISVPTIGILRSSAAAAITPAYPALTPRDAAKLFIYLRRVVTLPAEQMRQELLRAVALPSFPQSKVLEYAADMPVAARVTLLRRIMASYAPLWRAVICRLAARRAGLEPPERPAAPPA